MFTGDIALNDFQICYEFYFYCPYRYIVCLKENALKIIYIPITEISSTRCLKENCNLLCR